MSFGGAFAPNRFERISTLVAAWVKTQTRGVRRGLAPSPGRAPVGTGASGAAAHRHAAARRAAHGATVHIGIYRRLRGHLPRRRGAAAGGRGTGDDRPDAHVGGGRHAGSARHTRTRARATRGDVLGLAELGLHAAPAKVVVGDPVQALSMSVGRDEGRLRCPDGKRELLLAAMAELRTELTANARVPWQQARTVVGKLANLSQALPELKLVLRGGYAVARPAGAGPDGGRRRADEWLHLRPGGRAAREWQLMLDVATELVTANERVPLAPRRAFADAADEGCIVVTTDASGIDGVGGYCFRREPGDTEATAWLVTETWPAD
eukprot:3654235-Pleurochrysis_carterae.AAC.1